MACTPDGDGSHKITLHYPDTSTAMAAFVQLSDVADDAAESVLRQTAQQDIAGALYMIRSAVAGRVIQDDGQIRRRRAVQALFDGLPRCQTVAEADDREIMGQRRT